MTKQTKKLIAIFVVMAITMFAVIKAFGEITKVQEHKEGYDLYYSTQLLTTVEVVYPKDVPSLFSLDSTNSPFYKENYEGIPRTEETKILKTEEVVEDVLKLLDIHGAFYLTDSCWTGKKGGWHSTLIVWKEGEKIYWHKVFINNLGW